MHEVSFPLRTRCFFASVHPLLLKVQLHPTLKYCNHVSGGASSIAISLLDRILLINDPFLTSNLQSPPNCRAADLLALPFRLLSLRNGNGNSPYHDFRTPTASHYYQAFKLLYVTLPLFLRLQSPEALPLFIFPENYSLLAF